MQFDSLIPITRRKWRFTLPLPPKSMQSFPNSSHSQFPMLWLILIPIPMGPLSLPHSHSMAKCVLHYRRQCELILIGIRGIPIPLQVVSITIQIPAIDLTFVTLPLLIPFPIPTVISSSSHRNCPPVEITPTVGCYWGRVCVATPSGQTHAAVDLSACCHDNQVSSSRWSTAIFIVTKFLSIFGRFKNQFFTASFTHETKQVMKYFVVEKKKKFKHQFLATPPPGRDVGRFKNLCIIAVESLWRFLNDLALEEENSFQDKCKKHSHLHRVRRRSNLSACWLSIPECPVVGELWTLSGQSASVDCVPSTDAWGSPAQRRRFLPVVPDCFFPDGGPPLRTRLGTPRGVSRRCRCAVNRSPWVDDVFWTARRVALESCSFWRVHNIIFFHHI